VRSAGRRRGAEALSGAISRARSPYDSGGSGNSGFSFGSLSGSARWPGLPCRIFRIVGFGLQDLIGSRQLPSITREMIDEINETVAIARALMLEPSPRICRRS